MLEIRPNRECRDRDLPACSRELVRRPVRPAAALRRFPASVDRVTGGHDSCRAAALVS